MEMDTFSTGATMTTGAFGSAGYPTPCVGRWRRRSQTLIQRRTAAWTGREPRPGRTETRHRCSGLRPFAPARGRTDESWRIGPRRTSNDAPVREDRGDPLRLVATIRRGENTASDIFRRLNSHSRQHAPCQTLKSFGQIVKSLFIPRYADGLALRQAIERQLNGTEPANRFTRVVAAGNPRGLTPAE